MKQKKELSLTICLIPICFLIGLLSYNVIIYEEDATYGPNQIALLIGGGISTLIALTYGVKFKHVLTCVSKNINSAIEAMIILLLVGSLAGSWMISGIVPSMICYGLKLIGPSVFLPVSVILSACISLATGSSWSTIATLGVAQLGIGQAMGFSPEVIAGAVISGAYFGDKMSPLSDTTNLAATVSGTTLFTHIRYMTITTIPSIIIALLFFSIYSVVGGHHAPGDSTKEITDTIEKTFYISPILLLPPIAVIFMIIRKVSAIPALFVATVLGIVLALVFQQNVISGISGMSTLSFQETYKVLLQSVMADQSINTPLESLNTLFKTSGMKGMLNTIWLIFTAMVFGGTLQGSGILDYITTRLTRKIKKDFALFFSASGSCIALNGLISDQYLAVVLPGNMYAKLFKEKGLAPENLSRTLEDSGTVTSVLIPWNTCGATQSNILGVSTFAYFPYAVFNYVSPIMTLIVAYLGIKIRRIKKQPLSENTTREDREVSAS